MPTPPGRIVGRQHHRSTARTSCRCPRGSCAAEVRWQTISMVFQGAMNCLTPVYTVGRQMMETLQQHKSMDRDAGGRDHRALPRPGGPAARHRAPLPPRAVRGHEAARGHRHGPVPRAEGRHPRRADHGARRHRAGPDPQRDQGPEAPARPVDDLHHPRPRHRGGGGRPDHGDVRGQGRRDRAQPRCVYGKPPCHPYTQRLLAATPRLHAKVDELAFIPGAPPDLLDPPKGCRFQPRCSVAMDVCAQEPPLVEIEPGHLVACWRCTNA